MLGRRRLARAARARRRGRASPVVAVHVDHGLRSGSDADFAVVAAAAARSRCARDASARVAIDAGAQPRGPGARRAVRRRSSRRGRRPGASIVLVGHTADDQAETVLLNLLRGSASAGLAAMAPRQGTIVRPLLGLRRRDTLEICAASRPRSRRRPDERRDRGSAGCGCAARCSRCSKRARTVICAALLARQAEVMRDESDLLDALARRRARRGGRSAPRRAISRRSTRRSPRRALRLWLGGAPPSLATIDALLAVVAGERRALELAGRAPGRAPRRSPRARRRRSPSSRRRAAGRARASSRCRASVGGRAGSRSSRGSSGPRRSAGPTGARPASSMPTRSAITRGCGRPARGERFAPLGLRGHEAGRRRRVGPPADRRDRDRRVASSGSWGTVSTIGCASPRARVASSG